MRPILIAEACQNHGGDRKLLEEMIRAAAANGADYVKIQAARSRELTHRERFDEGRRDADGTVRVSFFDSNQSQIDSQYMPSNHLYNFHIMIFRNFLPPAPDEPHQDPVFEVNFEVAI